jgi:heparanase 1
MSAWALLARALVLPVAAAAALVVSVKDHVANEVLENYASVDLDWWGANGTPEAGSGGGWAGCNALDLDLSNPMLNSAVRAFGQHGGFLRVGGSLDNSVRYEMGGLSHEECTAPVPFRNRSIVRCLNASRWDALYDFANSAGLGIIWGLSFPHNSSAPALWNATNPEAFLRYSADTGKRIHGIELGEEMAPMPGTADFAGLLAAYRSLKSLKAAIWPDAALRPITLGPCVGMDDETPSLPSYTFLIQFVKDTLLAESGGPLLDAVCMHSYNNDGGNFWRKPGFLNQTLRQAEDILKLVKEARPLRTDWPADVWCGECGPVNDGGLANASNSFFGSFWYLDALGWLAAAGVKQFGRQSLVGSHYGLLRPGSFVPNPDFYVALAWKALMGKAALAVSGGNGEQLHVYAHCSRSATNGSVAVAFVNVGETAEHVELVLEGSSLLAINFWRYDFASGDAAHGIRSRDVRLNGRVLRPEGVNMPDVQAHGVWEGGTGGLVTVAPHSLGFLVFPDAAFQVCTKRTMRPL